MRCPPRPTIPTAHLCPRLATPPHRGCRVGGSGRGRGAPFPALLLIHQRHQHFGSHQHFGRERSSVAINTSVGNGLQTVPTKRDRLKTVPYRLLSPALPPYLPDPPH